MINTSLMTTTHQTDVQPWVWPLQGASRLTAMPEARWLVVGEGQVWLTRSEQHAGLSDDIWLSRGQRHRLPAGSEWVIEALPQAQLELLLAPPDAKAVHRLVGGLQRAWRLLAAGWTPRQPPSEACSTCA